MHSNRDFLYVFSYFKGHGDGLHLAVSNDGIRWKALNSDLPFVTPSVGPERLMRDPFLLCASDGIFHLVWTAGWRGKAIGYCYSPDLQHWSPQRLLGVMEHEPDAQNCWAPEIFYDDVRGEYILFWASSIPGRFPESDHSGDEGLNHRMYYTATRDFTTFSRTELFFDGGFNVIDATLVKDAEKYLLFMKDERSQPCQKNIRLSMSNSIFSGFDAVSPPITGSYWAEGPSAIQIDGNWVVYFDKYKLNQIGAVTSKDLVQWRDISHELHFPVGAQHGSVTKLPFNKVRHLL